MAPAASRVPEMLHDSSPGALAAGGTVRRSAACRSAGWHQGGRRRARWASGFGIHELKAQTDARRKTVSWTGSDPLLVGERKVYFEQRLAQSRPSTTITLKSDQSIAFV